jgi:hypothetical protein
VSLASRWELVPDGPLEGSRPALPPDSYSAALASAQRSETGESFKLGVEPYGKARPDGSTKSTAHVYTEESGAGHSRISRAIFYCPDDIMARFSKAETT